MPHRWRVRRAVVWPGSMLHETTRAAPVFPNGGSVFQTSCKRSKAYQSFMVLNPENPLSQIFPPPCRGRGGRNSASSLLYPHPRENVVCPLLPGSGEVFLVQTRCGVDEPVVAG